jgi:hypothetical protein
MSIRAYSVACSETFISTSNMQIVRFDFLIFFGEAN